MGYTITIGSRYGTTLKTIYDGSSTYPADKIKLVTGSNKPSVLSFRLAPSHPNYSYAKEFLTNTSNYSVVRMTHDTSPKSQSLLFVGEITKAEYDVNGLVSVTCKDYLNALDDMPLRLDEWGYDGEPKNLLNLMPSIMTKYNALRRGYVPSISGCTVVESYSQSGVQQTGRVIPDGSGTNVDRLLPTLTHRYDLDNTRTMLDLLKSLAESMGAVVTLVYNDSDNSCEIVFHVATSNPVAHAYRYGESLTGIDLWYDSSSYKNAAFVTGGTYRRTSYFGNNIDLKLVADSVIGADTITVRPYYGYQGGDVVPSGSLVCIDYTWYETVGEVTLPDYQNTVELSLKPYVQTVTEAGEDVDVWTSESASYQKAWDEATKPGSPSVSGYSTNSDRYVLKSSEVNKYGVRAFEFTDSNAVNSIYLANEAAREIGRRISLSRGIQASIAAIEVTHDYSEYDTRSHTMIGDVVHITHSALGIDEDLRVDGMSISVDNPTQNSYTFGLAKASSTQKLSDVNKSIGQSIYRNRRV